MIPILELERLCGNEKRESRLCPHNLNTYQDGSKLEPTLTIIVTHNTECILEQSSYFTLWVCI